MQKVRITILESQCRGGYHKAGEGYDVEDLCPPICHELWNSAYPMIYALQNGAVLDYGKSKAAKFSIKCPDGGRVILYGEVVEEYY